jgi:hypothetical protein
LWIIGTAMQNNLVVKAAGRSVPFFSFYPSPSSYPLGLDGWRSADFQPDILIPSPQTESQTSTLETFPTTNPTSKSS